MTCQIYYKMEKIIYLASDGTQFEHSRDCEKYCEKTGNTFKEVKQKINESKTKEIDGIK